MKEPAIPPNETARLAALHSLQLLDTPPEERFDRITRIARVLFNVPIALISFIDANRQWFKSAAGVDARVTPRHLSFCAHAILQKDVFVVEDTALDTRFDTNPAATGAPFVRFYAGAVIKGPGGYAVGSLCVIDHKPRHFDLQAMCQLQDLGAWVELELNAGASR
jgi:GAF domain-containing protein